MKKSVLLAFGLLSSVFCVAAPIAKDAVAARRALGFNEETSSKMVADVLAKHADVESVETVIKLALGSRA